MRKLTVFLFFLFLTISSFAMTMYISDTKMAVLYSQPNTDAQMIAQLSANEPVKLLKTNLESGYSYIETGKKDQGWVRTQYLVEQPMQARLGFFSRMLHRFLNNQNDVAIAAVKNSDHKLFSDQSETFKQQIAVLSNEVIAIKRQQHSSWFWFILGAIIALIGVFLGFLFSFIFSRQKSKRYY